MGSIMGFFDGIYDLLVGSSSYKHIQSYKRDDLLRWWTYDEDIFLNRFEIINQCSCSEYETVRYLAFLLVEISLRCHQAPVPVPYQCGIISLYIYWLVVWNISYCSIQLGIIIPICELIFFRGVGIPPTNLNHEFSDSKWDMDLTSATLSHCPTVPQKIVNQPSNQPQCGFHGTKMWVFSHDEFGI
jgi:hypothetical protein